MRTLKLLIIMIFMFFVTLAVTSCASNTVVNVNFDSNGGSDVSSITTNDVSSILIPDDPEKEGYSFSGWFIDNDTFLTPFTANSLLDESVLDDFTVYAKWQPIVYSIVYVLNGGTNNSNNPLTFDIESVLSLSDPVKENYTFGGWYTDQALTTVYVNVLRQTGDITLYAKWNMDSYTLQFVDSDGTVLETANYSYQADLTGVTPPVATKEGYTFTNWDTSLPLTMPSSNVTLTAQYTINQYTISFETNGGSLITELTQDYLTTIFAPSDPTKEGCAFVGWYQDQELTVSYDFQTMPSEDMTLYAKWENYQYTINYYIFGVDQVTTVPLSEGEMISDVSFGIGNSSIITSEGRVFTWGANSMGQLGIGVASTYKSVLTDISSSFGLIEEEKVIKILLGSQVSMAITSQGRIFTWGYSGNGQLGDDPETDRHIPLDITSFFNLAQGEVIADISLGSVNASAITSLGRIFTWGWNPHGQLGIGENDNIKIPTPVDITNNFNLDEGEKIILVSMGDGHSSALTSQGRIFTWGWNIYGQLGIGSTDNDTYSLPIEITHVFGLVAEESIVSICMSHYHSSVFTSLGRVFTFGYNGYGNLGDGTTVNIGIPMEISSNFNLASGEVISDISMSGYSHASAVTSEGRIFNWGSNHYGQLCSGEIDYDAHSIPIDVTSTFNLLSDEKIIRLSLGAQHSSAITSMGRVFTWGHGNAGQLGNASLANETLPVVITTVSNKKVHSETYDFEAQTTEYTLSKEGYTFSGWYTDVEMTVPYAFTTMPAMTLRLYGMWIGN